MANNPFAGVAPAAYTPGLNAHFQGGMTRQDDGSFEEYQRIQGNYTPGSMRSMTDQLDEGSDDQT